MRRFVRKRTLLAAAVAACSSVAYGQTPCDQDISQLEQEIEQRQVDSQLVSEVQDLLYAAEQNPADCSNYVARAEELLNQQASSSQSGQQTAQSGQQTQTQQGVEQASNVMGKSVTDSQGEDLGSIDDLAIDMQQGQLAYVVLSTGGMFTGKQVGVPANMLQADPQGDGYVAQVSKQQIEQAQELPDENWPAQPSVGSSQSSSQSGSQSSSQSGSGTVQPASELIGQSVKDGQGNDLGEIEDFAVDLQQGKLAYVALTTGDMVGGKVVGVPVDSLQPDQEGFVANLSQQQIEQAQELPDENWPQQPTVASSGQSQTSGSQAQSSRSQTAGTQSQSAGGVMQSDYLEGQTVTSSQGEELGQIAGFALDVQQGELAYVAIETSDGRKVGVAPERLQPSPDGRGYVADISNQELQSAQSLPDQNWPAEPAIGGSGGQSSSGQSVSFSSLDENQDGYISRSEAQRGDQQELSESFDDVDRNSDQQVDRTEFSAFEQEQDQQ